MGAVALSLPGFEWREYIWIKCKHIFVKQKWFCEKNVLVEHVLHPIVFTFNIFHILDQRRQGILETLDGENIKYIPLVSSNKYFYNCTELI